MAQHPCSHLRLKTVCRGQERTEIGGAEREIVYQLARLTFQHHSAVLQDVSRRHSGSTSGGHPAQPYRHSGPLIGDPRLCLEETLEEDGYEMNLQNLPPKSNSWLVNF